MAFPSHYEIFQKLPGKQAIWLEEGISLDNAKRRLKDLQQAFPGDYFIFDTDNMCFVVPCGDETMSELTPLGGF